MDNILTESHCHKILRKILNSDDYVLLGHNIEPLGKPLEGLIGLHYIVTISHEFRGKQHQIQVFLKTLNHENQIMYQLSKESKLDQRERLFYDHFIPEFQKMGIDVDFAPEAYLFDEEMVVLEDLSLKGYKGTPKQDPLGFDLCKKCLASLSKLHVAGMIFEHKKREQLSGYSILEEYGDVLKELLFTTELTGASKYTRCSIDGLCQIINLLPENNVNHEQFINKFKSVSEAINKLKIYSNVSKNTILHGDLWSNNFLHSDSDTESTKTKIIDFQTIKYGCPSVDVLQFIFTNTRKEMRDQYMDELLNYYYECITSRLQRYGLDGPTFFPKKEFLETCKYYATFAKMQAIMDRSTTFLSDECFGQVLKSDKATNDFLFKERGRYLEESFRSSKEYRELLVEDMLELQGMIFNS